MSNFYPVETLAPTGQTLYFVIRALISGSRMVWNPTLNTGAGGWEAYQEGHWSQYAIAMTEDTGSGYYAGVYPGALIFANAAGPVLTTEVAYIQGGGSPAPSDAPASGIGQSQGSNVAAVAGVAQNALNLGLSTGVIIPGALSGAPLGGGVQLPTGLTNAQATAAIGRSILMTSGVAIDCAARVVGVTGTGNTLVIAAPLGATPASADAFIIV